MTSSHQGKTNKLEHHSLLFTSVGFLHEQKQYIIFNERFHNLTPTLVKQIRVERSPGTARMYEWQYCHPKANIYGVIC